VCSGGNEFSANSTALIDRLYLNEGKGRFRKSPQILPSFLFESSSCVRGADFDGDADVDLFVGVRLKPFAYGQSCKGYLLENNGQGIFKDVTSRLAPDLLKAGMVTDGQWLDYDRDGKMDLALSGEYMPIRLLRNQLSGAAGHFREVTQQAGLGKSNGWWNRLLVVDVNNDGYADLVGGNHGLNSRFRATAKRPVRLLVSDFDQNGRSEPVLATYKGEKAYLMHLRHDLVSVLPYLKKKYLKYESYKEQTLQQVFSPQQVAQAQHLEAYTLQSSVFINTGQGGFTTQALPQQAQLSPVYGLLAEDFDGDGKQDLLLGGNFYEAKPEVGIYDASYGLLLKGNGNGQFFPLPANYSGFFSTGAIRDMALLTVLKKKIILIAKNNESIQVVQYP
jgi:hypothetical protein